MTDLFRCSGHVHTIPAAEHCEHPDLCIEADVSTVSFWKSSKMEKMGALIAAVAGDWTPRITRYRGTRQNLWPISQRQGKLEWSLIHS